MPVEKSLRGNRTIPLRPRWTMYWYAPGTPARDRNQLRQACHEQSAWHSTSHPPRAACRRGVGAAAPLRWRSLITRSSVERSEPAAACWNARPASNRLKFHEIESG